MAAVLVLIISVITFALLYVFGNYYNDMAVTKDRRRITVIIAIIIFIIDLYVISDYFSSYTFSVYGFTGLSDFIFKKQGFINSLGFGATLFLLVHSYQTIKYKIIISKLTPEERVIYEADELKRRKDAGLKPQEQIQTYKEYKENKEKQAKERAEAMNRTKSYVQLRCPKCKSTNLTANTKGFGLGKAAAGGVLLGPVGLLGGLIGSKKPVFICLNCGNQFKKNL